MMLAPAKLNLTLHVTGKRADGFHLLQSLVMFADVGDVISVQKSGNWSLQIAGRYAPLLQAEALENNLISRAAQALSVAGNVPCHAAVTLEKNLPIGAGLGGGSADAACVLKALNVHWQLGFSMQKLAAIGAPLGSDISACIHGAPLWMEGVGERISQCYIPFDIPVLLVYPNIHAATQTVYGALTEPYDGATSLLNAFNSRDELFAFLRASHNRLQAPAISLQPEITALLTSLEALPNAKICRMSGSGSACFALFDSPEHTAQACEMLRLRYKEYWIMPTLLRGTKNG